MITITIKTENAAFQDGNRAYEVARILRHLADRIGVDLPPQSPKLLDINGNTVGEVKLTGKDRSL
jgi:hypothetical protein